MQESQRLTLYPPQDYDMSKNNYNPDFLIYMIGGLEGPSSAPQHTRVTPLTDMWDIWQEHRGLDPQMRAQWDTTWAADVWTCTVARKEQEDLLAETEN